MTIVHKDLSQYLKFKRNAWGQEPPNIQNRYEQNKLETVHKTVYREILS